MHTTERPNVEIAGIVLTKVIHKNWRKAHEGAGIAAHVRTATWQFVWDQTGVFVDGSMEDFDRDITYLAMAIDDLNFPSKVENNP